MSTAKDLRCACGRVMVHQELDPPRGWLPTTATRRYFGHLCFECGRRGPVEQVGKGGEEAAAASMPSIIVHLGDVDHFLVCVDLGDGEHRSLVGCDPITLRRVRREPDAWIVWRAAGRQAMRAGVPPEKGEAFAGKKWNYAGTGASFLVGEDPAENLLACHTFPTISAALDDFCRLGGWSTWREDPAGADPPRPEDLELRAVVGVHLSDLDGGGR